MATKGKYDRTLFWFVIFATVAQMAYFNCLDVADQSFTK
jgi:hypothetical protein